MRRCLAWMVALGLGAAAMGGATRRERVAYVIRLAGEVHPALVESFGEEVRRATRPAVGKRRQPARPKADRPADVLILDLHTANGPLPTVLQLAEAIDKLHDDGIGTAALVHPTDSPAATLLALMCDSFFMARDARLVPLDEAAFAQPAAADGSRRILEALSAYRRRRLRPGLKLFHEALVDPSVEALALRLKGHADRVIFCTTEEYKRRRAAAPKSIEEALPLAEAGSRPQLDAAKALQLGVSAGTADTIEEVAQALRIAGRNLRMAETPGAVAAAQKTGRKAPPKKAPRLGVIGKTGPVVFIPLSGMVGDGMVHSIKRRIRDAEKLQPAIIIFEIDTFGGRLDAAFQIGEAIYRIHKARTVAYINDKAISAGAFIAVACDQIVMHRGSTFGDCQVVTPAGDAVRSEKIDSVLRARFRNFCEGKYPIALAMAMVTQELEVYELQTTDGKTEYLTGKELEGLTLSERARYVNPDDAKLIVSSKELLTMTDSEAKRYGFSLATVASREEVRDVFELGGRDIVVLGWSWSERLVRWLDVIGPLLLTLGILGIIIELKTPGFGVFGVVGLILVGVFFFGKHAAGLAEVWEILLFLVGVVLLAIEIFVTPGFGLLGLAGLVSMMASIVLSLQWFTVPRTVPEWRQFHWSMTQFGGVLLGVVVGMILISRYLHRTPYLGRIVLAQPQASSAPTSVSQSVLRAQPTAAEASRRSQWVGKRGQAVTMLRPAGTIELDGEPVDVVTEGEFINPGEPVEVCAVYGNRVVVRRAT